MKKVLYPRDQVSDDLDCLTKKSLDFISDLKRSLIYYKQKKAKALITAQLLQKYVYIKQFLS